MPEQCVQSPARTMVCDNLLYKRSPVELATPPTQTGQMVCICMSDFASIRIKAEPPDDKQQQSNAAKMAAELGMTPKTLLSLIRD